MASNNPETSEERFKRLATKRTNEILKRLDTLGNCANRQVYNYTQKEVDKIFKAIENKIKEVRARFHFPGRENFKL